MVPKQAINSNCSPVFDSKEEGDYLVNWMAITRGCWRWHAGRCTYTRDV